MSSKLEEIMNRNFVYCIKLILKEFMLKKNAKLKNTKNKWSNYAKQFWSVVIVLLIS